ncbi:putative effector protein, partial [Golovinomyces cichoracearum]
SAANTHLLLTTTNANFKGVATSKLLSEGQAPSDFNYDSEDSMESSTTQKANDNKDDDHIREDFPALSGSTQTPNNVETPSLSLNSGGESQESAASLTELIKGLLDLTNDYLKNLEAQHPGIGSDFLALIADGASRAMRGERVYSNISKSEPARSHIVQDIWAGKAKDQSSGTKVFNLKKQILKASPPKLRKKTIGVL